MYYSLRCPPPSLIVLARHALFIHEFSRPFLLVCHFLWVKLAIIFPVWRRLADRLTIYAYSRPSGQFPDAGCVRPSLF